jgi:hypothetical protein
MQMSPIFTSILTLPSLGLAKKTRSPIAPNDNRTTVGTLFMSPLYSFIITLQPLDCTKYVNNPSIALGSSLSSPSAVLHPWHNIPLTLPSLCRWSITELR